MAKGKTQFTCTEKRIDRGKWRWTVSYLGECLGTGIVKTQAECRTEKKRVKDEWLAKNADKVTENIDEGLRGKFAEQGDAYKQNFILDRGGRRAEINLPQQFITTEEMNSLALRAA